MPKSLLLIHKHKFGRWLVVNGISDYGHRTKQKEMVQSEDTGPIRMVTNKVDNETQRHTAPCTGGGPSQPRGKPVPVGFVETSHAALKYKSSFRIIQVRRDRDGIGKCQLRSCDPPAICLIHTGRSTASHYELVSSWEGGVY